MTSILTTTTDRTTTDGTTTDGTTTDGTLSADRARPGLDADLFAQVCRDDPAFALHAGGKLAVASRVTIASAEDLAMAYTPGVGRVSSAIAARPEEVWRLTGRSNAVAVLSDGSAVLGLGDIGPRAAMPVMEGKAILFKQLADIDAYPVCIDVHTADEIVAVASALAPTFGGINLEDIAAPLCFEVEQRLQDELDIPVVHDDQHGTAIVVLAALSNAARVVGKELSELTVAVVGLGAAGTACGRLLHAAGVGDIVGVDRDGIVGDGPGDDAPSRRWFVDNGNRCGRRGGIDQALRGADVMLGLSRGGTVEPRWLEGMASASIVFALANPTPEIEPAAVPGSVAVMATGRSDHPNQINNVLAFPGLFRGLLDSGTRRCTTEVKLAAAGALAALVPDPDPTHILPSVFDDRVVPTVAGSVRSAV